jgi:O-antigen ligase
MSVYGIYNYVTASNPYDSLISNAFDVNSSFDVYKLRGSEGDRFRINSFTAHPITYGFVVGVLLLIFLADISNSAMKNKRIFIFVSVLLFINLLMTNSRTPLVAFTAGLLLFVTFKFNLRKKLKYLLITFFFGFLLYSMIPFIQDKVDSVIDIAETGGEKEEGSNVEMRVVQLAASYNYFIQSPIYGNGFGYIEEDLGWGDSEDRVYDDDLRGFESWFFVLLIESGILGIIANFLFVIGLVLYFFRNMKRSRLYASIGLSITVMFVLFSLSTGNLGSWMISMTSVGILIKLIELKRKNICLIK